VRETVLIAGCDPLASAFDIGSDISNRSTSSSPLDACLSAIQTCADYTNCTGYSFATSAECPAGATSTTGTCDGSHATLTSCSTSSSENYKLECSTVGATACVVGSRTGCEVTTCSEADGTPGCTANNDEYTCYGGIGFGENCTRLNATCVDGACHSMAAQCPATGTSCDGDKLEGCSTALLSYEDDCRAVGLHCVQDSSGAVCAAPNCMATDARSCVSACAADGTTANVCVGGAHLPIDCTMYGFSSCGYVTDSQNNRHVHCLP
jgi:hypothetical protein